MKLNQATDYAFRMVLHMALLPSGSKITGAVLAEQELIPELDVIRAVEGDAYLQRCLYDVGSCSKSCKGHCAINEAMGVIQHQLINQLEAVNFKTLAQREQLIIAEA